MFHRTFLAACIAATAIVSAPAVAPPAAAAPAVCQGEVATIVGTPQTRVLRGTPERDVILSRGDSWVLARGGDDLICVTSDNSATVQAGPGDDEVHVTSSAEGYNYTELGPGADSFHGGDGWDIVWAGVEPEDLYQTPDPTAQDAERDVISTGRAPDIVFAGEPDVSFLDQIDTGPGGDELTVMATVGDGTALLDLGLGFDQVHFKWPEAVGGDWLFDNGAEVVTRDGVAQLGWAGVERFDLPDLSSNPVSFHGSDHSERVDAGRMARVELGGGADSFSSDESFLEHPTSAPGLVEGGAGRDVFVADTYEQVVVNLARGRVTSGAAHVDDVLLSGIENVTAYGDRDPVEIRGDAGDNIIRAAACYLTAVGAAGDDRIISKRPSSESYDCSRGSSVALRGGTDNDLLRGAGTPDRLVGGPGRDRMFGRGGRDVAIGGDGRDTCGAEVRRSCGLP